jgi:hypothetical protein
LKHSHNPRVLPLHVNAQEPVARLQTGNLHLLHTN